jgi:hypothetical protein
MIPAREWKWFGHAGHFVCGNKCRFHLCTQVGRYLVSTVGEYLLPEPLWDVLGPGRGITPEGIGDAREADWIKKNGFERLGAGEETFESMVFLAGLPCEDPGCGCGMPKPISWSEMQSERWMTAGEATRGHLAYCRAAAHGQSYLWLLLKRLVGK